MWPAPSICASIWYASDRRAPWKKNTARKARSGTLRPYRGSNNMYRGVTISVKALTGAILAGLAALALAIVFLAGSGGFTVTFETDGGSQVPAQTCRYGELVRRPEDPVKEGYVFDGWYWDVEREHRPWDFAQDTVEDSMYLYARWQPVP